MAEIQSNAEDKWWMQHWEIWELVEFHQFGMNNLLKFWIQINSHDMYSFSAATGRRLKKVAYYPKKVKLLVKKKYYVKKKYHVMLKKSIMSPKERLW